MAASHAIKWEQRTERKEWEWQPPNLVLCLSLVLCARSGSRGVTVIWEKALKTSKVTKNNQNNFSLILKHKTFGKKPLKV